MSRKNMEQSSTVQEVHCGHPLLPRSAALAGDATLTRRPLRASQYVDVEDQLKESVAYIKSKLNGFVPAVALILGSGLGAFPRAFFAASCVRLRPALLSAPAARRAACVCHCDACGLRHALPFPM